MYTERPGEYPGMESPEIAKNNKAEQYRTWFKQFVSELSGDADKNDSKYKEFQNTYRTNPEKDISPPSLRDFTFEPDYEMPETDSVLVVSFRKRPAFHIDMRPYPFEEDQGIKESPDYFKKKIYTEIKNCLASYPVPDYLNDEESYYNTGMLKEMPVAWFKETTSLLRAKQNEDWAKKIGTQIGDPNFLEHFHIRQNGYDNDKTISLAFYYKGKVCYTVHIGDIHDPNSPYGSPEKIAEWVQNKFTYEPNIVSDMLAIEQAARPKAP